MPLALNDSHTYPHVHAHPSLYCVSKIVIAYVNFLVGGLTVLIHVLGCGFINKPIRKFDYFFYLRKILFEVCFEELHYLIMLLL